MIYARENLQLRSQETHRWEVLLECSITIIIGASTKVFLLSGRCSRELRSILLRKKYFITLMVVVVVQILVMNWRDSRSLMRITGRAHLLLLLRLLLPRKIED
ncbi:hypothetical protein CARUB_v10028243mg [Capsella rubella]|uniref:Uncharacterized protein n=1 Tax=Capsella rubella TaxID=81985 RepID=R0GKA9_9BRAS|nr:hypothetical protein CARUB_v10028243mg [Capsella rubella]